MFLFFDDIFSKEQINSLHAIFFCSIKWINDSNLNQSPLFFYQKFFFKNKLRSSNAWTPFLIFFIHPFNAWSVWLMNVNSFICSGGISSETFPLPARSMRHKLRDCSFKSYRMWDLEDWEFIPLELTILSFCMPYRISWNISTVSTLTSLLVPSHLVHFFIIFSCFLYSVDSFIVVKLNTTHHKGLIFW